MISFKNKALLILLLVTAQNHASNNSFASWLTFFKTKFTALKNSLPYFTIPRFDVKQWFFKKPQPIPSKPIEKPLEIIDLTDMRFSPLEDPIDNDMAELTNLINQATAFPDQKKVLAHYTAILDKKWKELTTDFEMLLVFNAGKALLQEFFYFKKKYLQEPYMPENLLKENYFRPLRKLAKKDIWLTDMLTPFDEQKKNISKSWDNR